MSAPTELTPEQERVIAEASRDKAWRAGDLSWMLDEGRPSGPQRTFYEQSKASRSKTFVTEYARRLGKTHGHAIIAIELALKNPGRRINWCQDTAKGIRDAAVPLFEKICKDAPPDCKGVFRDQRSRFEFPNGAYIFIFGGDSKQDADNARGGDDPIASFIDEGGFVALLKYIYTSIIKPGMKKTRRKGHFGMIFVCSSTPEDLDHYFIELADINEAKGSYINRDIYAAQDAERYIAEEAADLNLTVEQFMRTDAFLREMLNRRIVNPERIVFPEAHTSNFVREWTRPIGFEMYVQKRVSIDLGMQDKTGLLFGYTDFVNAKAVIEDESLMTRPNTEQIALEIKRKEAELWVNADPRRTSRVVDDPHGRVVLDLWELHKISCDKAIKHDRDASIGLIRTWLLTGALVVHPRCVNLIKHLKYAQKTRTGRDFAEAEDGHWDLAAAAMYFVRGLDLTKNCYPNDFNPLTGRSMPEDHPLMIRRELMGVGSAQRGLAGALLGGNKFVSGQLRRRR